MISDTEKSGIYNLPIKSSVQLKWCLVFVSSSGFFCPYQRWVLSLQRSHSRVSGIICHLYLDSIYRVQQSSLSKVDSRPSYLRSTSDINVGWLPENMPSGKQHNNTHHFYKALKTQFLLIHMEIAKTTDGLAQRSKHCSKLMLQRKIQCDWRHGAIFKRFCTAARRHTANLILHLSTLLSFLPTQRCCQSGNVTLEPQPALRMLGKN